jgi:hypothetical protein
MIAVDDRSATTCSPGACDPDQSRPLAVLSKRTIANRQNALKSTGPRTPAGKLAAANNSLGHGILALCPVIRPLESQRDWERYRAEMLTSLAPFGMLEATLAERLIFTAWRLRRAARYEVEHMRLTQESAADTVVTEFSREREFAAAARQRAAESVVAGVEESVREILEGNEPGAWDEDEPVADDTELDCEDARSLLRDAHEQCDQAAGFDDYWERLPKPEQWTAGTVRRLARALADQHFYRTEEPSPSDLNRRLDVYRREHLLPDAQTLEKVMRYETHLSRQLHRDLHELQRLQGSRQGKPVAAPIAIDVEVASGPETTPGNGG